MLWNSCTRTWTVWTCGDWITDGWAAWITPWTWTVCPLGNCTKVTVGAEDVAWAAAMDTWERQTVWLTLGLYHHTHGRHFCLCMGWGGGVVAISTDSPVLLQLSHSIFPIAFDNPWISGQGFPRSIWRRRQGKRNLSSKSESYQANANNSGGTTAKTMPRRKGGGGGIKVLKKYLPRSYLSNQTHFKHLLFFQEFSSLETSSDMLGAWLA